MPAYGVILPIAEIDAAATTEVDYVEPTIVGNLVVEGPGGRWIENPEYRGTARSPSFAILFPGDLAIADPAFPAERITRYLEDVLGIIGRRAIEGAKIVLGSGRARTIPEGVEREAAERRFAEVVVEARDLARANGVRIVLEPLHRGETNLIHSLEEAAAFLDAHAIDDVPVVADLFHIMLEQEPLERVRAHAARVAHAHIADAERRPPGQGDWPLREFLVALREGGYEGDVTIECHWQDVAAELPAALAAVRSADPLGAGAR